MGASLTIPSPTARPQVIVAGLPRTGTASLCAALAIILDGPVYHGGTQMSHGPSSEVLSWIRLLKLFPFTHATRPTVLSIIQDRCEGYVAVADGPVRQLVPELMELYPDAVVVCSTRDAVEWERSFGKVAGTATQWFLKFVLLPLSPTRYFVEYVKLVMRQWDYLYGESNPQTTRTYLRHVEWMSEAVPKDKLVFFDVKEGWGPLCEALGKKVPDIKFPKINDAEAIESVAKGFVIRGLVRWAVLIATLGLAMPWFWRRDREMEAELDSKLDIKKRR